ncbi:MAG: HAD-IB family phosphatase [Anaerolineae bacterium]|nr:HAD-IB family phosphatase [Anaerolineae bacterium]
MRWPPYKHVLFDCDSTLTAIEGIDALAATAGKGWRVEVLTRAAMDGDLDLHEIYERRLRAVKPTRQQIAAMRQQYKDHVVEDARAVIAALRLLGHEVYIISGGLAEPVAEFGIFLGVPRENIRAVPVAYNELSGRWWLNDENTKKQYRNYEPNALTVSSGKPQIVRELLHGKRGRALLVGDGVSDLLARAAVDLFVGYGGVVIRQRVRAEAPVFLHSRSLAPVLALAAGPAQLARLEQTPHAAVAARAWTTIDQGEITFNDERIAAKFREAYQAVHPRPD